MKEMESNNIPMSDIQRVIVETKEKNPKIIAQVTANKLDVNDDFRVRIKPLHDSPKQLILLGQELKDITITDQNDNLIAVIYNDGQIIGDKDYKVTMNHDD